MVIYINEANFLIDLLDKFKSKAYIYMRDEEYSMDNMLNFINGYSLVVEYCYCYVSDACINTDYAAYDPATNFKNPIFKNYDETIKALDEIVSNCKMVLKKCNQWNIIGIKYAICLAKFYIKNVIFSDDIEAENRITHGIRLIKSYIKDALFGDYTEVEEDGLYMDIPDEDDPDDYDWESCGWNYDF